MQPPRQSLRLLLVAFLVSPGIASSNTPTGPGCKGEAGLAIRAAKLLVVPPEGPQVIDNGVLVIKDGKIEAVGHHSRVEIPDGYAVEDVGARWLMPGMVELHNHIGPISPFFPNDLNDTVYLTNPGLRAAPTVYPGTTLQRWGTAGGVTSALFIPGSGSNMGGAGIIYKMGFETFEEMEFVNPGSLKLAQSGNPERWTTQPQRSFMNWNTRNTFKRGLAYARRWAKYEAGKGEKPEMDLQFEIFRPLYRKDIAVSTHTQIYQVVLMTITMVKQELDLDVFIDHGSFDGFKTGALAQESGVPAILGPRNICPPYGRFIDTDGAIVGMAAGYQERGHTNIGFNTDCVDNGTFGITPPQEELSLQAGIGVRYGLDISNLENVRGLTIVPAMAAHIDDRVGSLEVGKDADVLVLRGDPGDPRMGVDRVYVNGHAVYDAERDGRRW